MRKYIDEEQLSTKQNKIKKVNTLSGTNLLLEDNTEYRLSNIAYLSLTYPTGDFEIWMKLTLNSSGGISINFPSTTKYLGQPPVFSNGQTWEISIKDGIVAAWRVA